MTDLDTSGNSFDPRPSLLDLIAEHRVAEANRSPGAPIRIHRVAHLKTHYWQRDADYLEVKFRGLRGPSRAQFRSRDLAQTGEHLGLERVGLVVETVTEDAEILPLTDEEDR